MELDHKIVCKLFGFTKSTFYNWKKEKRPVIMLLEKYFSDDDLKEWNEHKKIQKLDNLKLLNKTADEIVINFFYEKYTNNFINDEFAEIIFPEYIQNENQYVEKRKKVYQEMLSKRLDEEKKEELDSYQNFYPEFNKRGLTKFIAESNFDFDKTSALLQIAPLNDLEIHLLVSTYSEFLSKKFNVPEIIKIRLLAKRMKEIEKEVIVLKK